ncbi:hypothetical protein QC760_003775 [Botrytis cinerea]
MEREEDEREEDEREEDEREDDEREDDEREDDEREDDEREKDDERGREIEVEVNVELRMEDGNEDEDEGYGIVVVEKRRVVEVDSRVEVAGVEVVDLNVDETHDDKTHDDELPDAEDPALTLVDPPGPNPRRITPTIQASRRQARRQKRGPTRRYGDCRGQGSGSPRPALDNSYPLCASAAFGYGYDAGGEGGAECEGCVIDDEGCGKGGGEGCGCGCGC